MYKRPGADLVRTVYTASACDVTDADNKNMNRILVLGAAVVLAVQLMACHGVILAGPPFTLYGPNGTVIYSPPQHNLYNPFLNPQRELLLASQSAYPQSGYVQIAYPQIDYFG
ncbi:uncharacterized protein LOC124596357 [Schistocerca americana]|uniref:uncharacterized protein LOC124596357 n=1 Tax=Schistocerca americana TaxID=7009 RepID=UPI001F500AF2|nr:uncharacterized protein LOC124596357 [Schistocerca americana]XP_049947878.1 uncharacterized protein LOC126456167 [Schistocerca serialis cubense]